MDKIKLNKIINFILLLYIISLYLLSYRAGLNFISNLLAIVFFGITWGAIILKNKKIIFNKYTMLYLLFIIISMISILYSLNKEIALSKNLTLIQIFILIITIINYIDTFDKLKNILNYFIYAGLITSVYLLLNADFTQTSRIGGELGNLNDLGNIIGISFILGFNRMLNEKKIIFLIALLPMLFSIFLTGSRQALLLVLISIFIILILNIEMNISNIIKYFLIVIIMVVGIYYLIFNIPIFYQIVGIRVEELLSFITNDGTNDASVNLRGIMIQFGLDKFKENPLLGIGIDNYRVLFQRYYNTLSYAHNNFVELLVDIGIVGTCVYYTGIIDTVKNIFNIQSENKIKKLINPILALIISYSILGVAQVHYDDKHFNILMALASLVPRVADQMKVSYNSNINY